MKKSDIAMIVLISGISMIIAFVVANQLSFLKLPTKGETIQTVVSISPEAGDPDPGVFNSGALNPTVQTFIGGSDSGD